MHIINTLLPVFFVIGLGTALRKSEFLSKEFTQGLNRLVYWVGMPCFLFHKITTVTYDFATAGKVFTVLAIGMAGCIVIAYIFAIIAGWPKNTIGAFVQGAYRGNIAYIGIPVLVYSMTNSSPSEKAGLEATGVLVLAFVVVMYNITAVLVLLAAQHKIDRYMPLKMARQIITNPLLIASVLGLVYSLFFEGLGVGIERSLAAIGQMTLPLALLNVGACLAEEKVAGRIFPAVNSSAIKVFIAPAIGLLAAIVIGLEAGETKMALLFLASPTAVSSYILAQQLQSDDKLAATIVVMSAILSILSLSIVVGFF
ncbi:MAG: AEC family transporter [Planctomycetota bacterium]|jgi:predicted permease